MAKAKVRSSSRVQADSVVLVAGDNGVLDTLRPILYQRVDVHEAVYDQFLARLAQGNNGRPYDGVIVDADSYSGKVRELVAVVQQASDSIPIGVVSSDRRVGRKARSLGADYIEKRTGKGFTGDSFFVPGRTDYTGLYAFLNRVNPQTQN